jgi:hypothetical protein
MQLFLEKVKIFSKEFCILHFFQAQNGRFFLLTSNKVRRIDAIFTSKEPH